MKVDEIMKRIRNKLKYEQRADKRHWLKELEEAFICLCNKEEDLGKGEELHENIINILHEWAVAYEECLWDAFWEVFPTDIFDERG